MILIIYYILVLFSTVWIDEKTQGQKVKSPVKVIQVVRMGLILSSLTQQCLLLTLIFLLAHIKDPSHIAKQGHGKITSYMDFIVLDPTLAIFCLTNTRLIIDKHY